MASPPSRFLEELAFRALLARLFEDIEDPDPEEDPGPEEDRGPENLLRFAYYEEWKRQQEVFRRERNVIALEITNPFSENCRRIRPQFERLARDFGGVPFVSVLTGPTNSPFITTDRVSSTCLHVLYMSVLGSPSFF